MAVRTSDDPRVHRILRGTSSSYGAKCYRCVRKVRDLRGHYFPMILTVHHSRELDKIRSLFLGYSYLGLSSRAMLAVSMQADIQACSARLQEARAQFTVKMTYSGDYASNFYTRQNAQLNVLIAGRYPTFDDDDFRITGAVRLQIHTQTA